MIRCPSGNHEDLTPSCELSDGGELFCYSCEFSTTIHDMQKRIMELEAVADEPQMTNPITLHIPRARRDEFIQLAHEENESGTLLSHYRVWKFIEAHVPEFESGRDWHIDASDVLNPVIRSGSDPRGSHD